MPTKKGMSIDWEVLIAAIARGKTPEKYGAEQRIFDQGQPADSIFYIRKGKVKLSVVSQQGKEAIVATLSAGHCVLQLQQRSLDAISSGSRNC
jgi:CRP/FNR family cyclic AMP-dependent transcriptional regulator